MRGGKKETGWRGEHFNEAKGLQRKGGMCAFTVSGSHEMRGNRRRGGEGEGEGVTGVGVCVCEHGGGDGNPRHVFTVLVYEFPGQYVFGNTCPGELNWPGFQLQAKEFRHS